MRRRALEKAAKRWWRLPESRWSNADHYAYSRVDTILLNRSLVGPMFTALVATAPRTGAEDALKFLGAAWFEDVINHYQDDGEQLLLRARVTPWAWGAILSGTYPEYQVRVPRLVDLAART